MDIFLKATAAALVGLVMNLILSKQNKDSSLLLTVMICCTVAIAAMNYFHPLIDFLRKLREIGGLDSELFTMLLKATGIALIAEIATLICVDFGNAATGKVLQLLATVVILWISLPLLNRLVDLITGILETV